MAGPTNNIPSFQQLGRYSVNVVGKVEGVAQTLYDSQTYAAAGQTQLMFFQSPQSSGRTLAATNMLSAGQLPSGNRFLCTGISIAYLPVDLPVTTGAAVAAANFTNDVYTFSKNGWLNFHIGNKDYLQEAPLGRFPPRFNLRASPAVATTVAADQYVADYASVAGIPYSITPVLLEPTQNFNVSLNWPTAVATPSTHTATVFVILSGYLYRNAQ